MRGWASAAMGLLAVFVLGGAGHAEPTARPLTLKRAVVELKDGQIWGLWGHSALCDVLNKSLVWRADTNLGEKDVRRMAAIFDEEVTTAGLRGSAPASLFEDIPSSGGLQVGAVVKSLNARLCGNWNYGVSEVVAFRVSANMTIEWQVYDPIQHQVIGRVTTSAMAESREQTKDALSRIILLAFRQNAKSLVTQPEFLRLVRSEQTVASAQASQPIAFAAAKSPAPPANAVSSVVLVQTDDGHGSGFLISGDGYMLTNAHVVGSASTVQVKWSDGFQAPGEVLRVDKRRDVALIRTSAHSRAPLALRPGLATAGEPVFAIGAPLDPRFQGTLTRGVVSAPSRLFDGLNFIQSDVTVNPGNSGGPLLDEKGRVIGITDLAFQPEGMPTGINLFIPIGDALDFLNLKPAT